ncbi:LacI family DNA-binding transcriptional regulator [Tabrizicola sp. J26]|uniref:LacI family DNA-binding transcriptional regulator n=1 Tax=Alitabrizicola rongguiensis TaxID=2909234 RepID=UPI001F1BC664|nr:LacI family DNA-binding transcriptional regulator [Tabrizicola rongguiensis]MCF1707960.1 LacI family DNA-binding transcriptional regulator [Tabrizicola rongguiensis]
MPRRPGMSELAQAAGVSVATIDRLLNGRQAVAAATRAHVIDVAHRIGHPAAARLGAAGTAQLPEIRFGVVLHKQGQDFYKAFAQELHRAVAEVYWARPHLVLEFSASQAPSEMAALLRSMEGRCDVLAATAVNHPEVTAAVEDLNARGLRVFSLLSEFAPSVRAGYLGLDNLKVGRTAGWLMALTARQPGKVALFVGGHRWHGHELRESGFRSFLRECAPHLDVTDTMVNLETRQLTYEATLALAARHQDLRGVYVAGGGMEGAIAALRELRAAGRIALIVSALTPESRAGLAEGLVDMVIDTPLDRLCRALFQTMGDAALNRQAEARIGEIFLPPQLHVAESI